MMAESIRRVTALIYKEIITLLQDKKTRFVLIGPPILQLFVFALAATLEVKNISTVIFNQDGGRHGYELIQRINGSPTFTKIKFVNTESSLRKRIDKQKALVAIHIPQNFSQLLEAGKQAKIQVIMDGRKSNTAQIVSGYITQLATQYGQELQNKGDTTLLLERNWFNPNLVYLWMTIPSLVCTLSMMIALIVTSLSVARERELGTFDQILVSPLMLHEILIGKVVPAVVIAMFEGLIIWGCGVFVLKVPFTGSFFLLLIAIFCLVMSIVGIGLCISAISKTQQQAILGTFIFMVPAVTLSGYASPIENMPKWLQVLTYANPLKYSLVTVRGLFLKNISLAEVLMQTWPVIVICLCTMMLASYFFSTKLE
jgi:ABC-2 type transport system permease protein